MNERVRIVLDRLGSGKRGRTSRGGEQTFVPCPCHDDHDPSLSIVVNSNGTVDFTCMSRCGRLKLEDLESALGLSGGPGGVKSPDEGYRSTPGTRGSRKRSQGSGKRPDRDPDRRIGFEYLTREGIPTHRKIRLDWFEEEFKECYYTDLQGRRGRPEAASPVYGWELVLPGDVIVVVEGELCVEHVNDLQATWEGRRIRAVTYGGGPDTEKAANPLADFLAEFEAVYLWPDNDSPGIEAMSVVARALQAIGKDYALIDPHVLFGQDETKQDVADLVQDEVDLIGSLSQFRIQSQVRITPPSVASPEEFIANLKIFSTGEFVYPGTNRVVGSDTDSVAAAWYANGNAVPTDSKVKTLKTLLRNKANTSPTVLAYRLYQVEDDGFYYRVDGRSKLVHVNGKVDLQSECPSGVHVAVTETGGNGREEFSGDVDMTGRWDDFLEVGEMYHLSEQDLKLMECSLCCTFLGMSTPMWILEGSAGSGKTSLARMMAAVVEPTVPFMDSKIDDPRAMISLLRKSPVLIMDNMTKISQELSNRLCKLITGDREDYRPLYSNLLETIYMKKFLIMTVLEIPRMESDLITRMISFSPSTQVSGKYWGSERWSSWARKLVPRLRGYIFRRCSESSGINIDGSRVASSRLSDLEVIAYKLGYDGSDLVAYMGRRRVEALVEGDSWLGSILEICWQEGFVMETFTYLQLKDAMTRKGAERLGEVESSYLGRWLSGKRDLLARQGVLVDLKRSESSRYVVIRRDEQYRNS